MLLLAVAIIAVLVAVFTLQNTQAVTVTLVAWRIAEVPLAAVVLSAFALGAALVGVPLWIARWRLRSRLRARETPPAQPPGGR